MTITPYQLNALARNALRVHDVASGDDDLCMAKNDYLIMGNAMREAGDRILSLENAMHSISLGSQNSMTSKEDLGRLARESLKGSS